MRIAISLNATDVEPDEAQRAFSTAVRALRKASTSDGEVWGTFHAGQATVDASEVTDTGSLLVRPVAEDAAPTDADPNRAERLR